MLDSVAGAGTAVVARRPTTILEAHLLEGIAPVLPQEILVEAGREVVPGKHLVLGAVAMYIPVDIESMGRHGLEPKVVVEML